MKEWRGYRQALTLDEIGRNRFWIGLFASVSFATVFYFFFGGIRDATAVVIFALGYGHPTINPTSAAQGAWVKETNPFVFSPLLRYTQNLFAAGVAVAVAQSAAISIWLTHRGWRETPRTRRHRNWSLTWAVMWSWLVAWYLLKFGQTYWLYIYLSTWSQNPVPELDLFRDYGWLLALLVTVLFLEQWKGLRLTYRCGRWVLIATLASAMVALILALFQPLNW